ncbi:MAG: succinate--CoA ligase subunit alpha [Deltaproteobacteria bacterium]|nr:succinate--CoA ligase subunit alpha [Deltaproteobacteria bacterium]
MRLDEHTSKTLLARADVPVSQGLALTGPYSYPASITFPPPWVVKAQALTGGRGKAGGVVVVDRAEDLPQVVSRILGMRIGGHPVPYVRIEQAVTVKAEFYLSLAFRRRTGSLLLTVNRAGGIDVESASPEDLLIEEAHPLDGPGDYQIREAFFHLNLAQGLMGEFLAVVRNLIRLFFDQGLILLEINPLALTDDGHFLALDAKIEVDDNWVDLRPDLQALYLPDHHSPMENEAREAGLSYHKLDGWVGMVVNGAGLAMATMDVLNDHGLRAANFLDLGGGADSRRMARAFAILLGDADVKVLFVNIFGGILSCRAVAEAMRQALEDMDRDQIALDRPLVVRFSGFRSSEGRKILEDMGRPEIFMVSGLDEALDRLGSLAGSSDSGPRPEPGAEPGNPQTLLFDHPIPCFGLGRNTPVLVQGITGRNGILHTELMKTYGTRIVAGVTPGKGGRRILGIPVYDTVRQAQAEHDIQASIVFVPAAFATDAILEAAAADIPWVVCITEGIPQSHMLRVQARLKHGPTRLIGPNTPGLIVPGEMKLGIMPGDIFRPGPVAVLSRSGTLTYETVNTLSAAGIGQSICLGIGGDPFVGSDFESYLDLLETCPATRALLVLGEIGGQAEERLAQAVSASKFSKPVLAFIAGRTAPPGKKFGHAGAIIREGSGGIEAKIESLRRANIEVCSELGGIVPTLVRALARRTASIV